MTEDKKPSKPNFTAYDETVSGFTFKIGAAWPHKKGEGTTLLLMSIP